MSSRRSDSEDIQLKSKLPCIRCNKSAKTNAYCTQCHMTICITHSSQMSPGNQERICDECLEDFLSSQLPDTETTIENIHNEIQEIATTRENNTKNLCKISTQVLNTREQCMSKQELLHNEDILLEENVKKTKGLIKTTEESIGKKIREEEKLKEEIEFAKEKINGLDQETEKSSKELKELMNERNTVLSELNELREFVKMQVPVRLVKRIVCSMCYPRVLVEYHKIFKPENATTGTEIRSSSVSQEPLKKKGACGSCQVF
ncbi:hypothetical protein SteCoe_27802 [Stentor coeruleus]|uniref:Uncharacterized protein n=1 Tax=Stentor coeruleus TaxID=5963 RepID=A0A1R2B9Q6_9CILI|nr:hypothetical protein SteCoe_27802 [Stentor coeruleus]